MRKYKKLQINLIPIQKIPNNQIKRQNIQNQAATEHHKKRKNKHRFQILRKSKSKSSKLKLYSKEYSINLISKIIVRSSQIAK